jgi:hypothetical protein
MSLVAPPGTPKFRREHATSKSIPRGAVDGRSCQPDTMRDSAGVPMEEPKNSGSDLPVTVTDQGIDPRRLDDIAGGAQITLPGLAA